MTLRGTAVFISSDGYQAAVAGAKVSLVLTSRGDFNARATWLKLRELHVFRGCEDLARIAYMSWLPTRSFISFPVGYGAPMTWSGVELGRGDIVLHARGERSHQRTNGATKWGLVSLPLERLAAYGKALTGVEIVSPAVGRVLRPSLAAVAHLLRLHSRACDLVEARPEIVSHEEAARALEQELVHALVNCLATGGEGLEVTPSPHRADVMVSFEEAISPLAARQPRAPELSAAIGMSERTLRVCCAKFLGMSPGRYMRLRRLNMVRAELHRASPATSNIAEIARRYQFSELGRFAASYRAVFGEMPSDTLRRIPIVSSPVPVHEPRDCPRRI
jgi:AraC-like DNA-binding protein